MSSRYSICVNAGQLTSRYGVHESPAFRPFYNAAPSQLLPVITNTGPQGISYFYWGLTPEWAGNKPITEKMLHVKAEVIPEKPMYRKMLSERRCLVPADGFYEWRKIGKKTMIPWRYFLRTKEVFSMAGLWEEYEDENGEQFHTFSLITCPANELVSNAHDRMPVILPRETEMQWISPSPSSEELLAMLTPFDASKMDGYTVSARINTFGVNDPTLILPAPSADQFGNLTLFD